MKKLVAFILAVVILVTCFASCSKLAKCSICGDKGICKTEEILGQEINICTDCQKEIEKIGNIFG